MPKIYPDEDFKAREAALARKAVWTYGYGKALRDPFLSDTQVLDTKSSPWTPFQYDLELFFFLNYSSFPTAVPRHEHLLRAAELRWPSGVSPDGRSRGKFVRNPWLEIIAEAWAGHSRINMFGGGGQGKTTMNIGLALMIFDYFSQTEYGARFCVSSVEERKLKGAAWAELNRLYPNREGAAPYSCLAGRGRVLNGDMMIRRAKPFDKDERGITRGVLLSPRDNVESQIDKITGGHVQGTAVIYLVDEAQSTETAPIYGAESNIFLNAKHPWLIQTGNPTGQNESYGLRCKPETKGGYETVSAQSKYWLARNDDGHQVLVLHFNNEHSPGMADPKQFWFLPTEEKKAKIYESELARMSLGYTRMWEGWFTDKEVAQTVLSWQKIELRGANLLPTVASKNPLVGRRLLSIDPAPASIDRAQATVAELVEEVDGVQRLHFLRSVSFPKVSQADFYDMLIARSASLCKEFGIPSGNIIFDNTNMSGIGAMFRKLGLNSHPFIYSVKASEEPVFVSRASGVIKGAREIGSARCKNLRSEMLLLLRNFVECGQVRGLNESLIIGSQRTLADEICTLGVEGDPDRGEFLPVSTKDFRKTFGFSPDVLMTLAQAAWFARTYWGIVPGILKKEFEETKKVDKSRGPGYIFGRNLTQTMR